MFLLTVVYERSKSEEISVYVQKFLSSMICTLAIKKEGLTNPLDYQYTLDHGLFASGISPIELP